MMHRAFGCLIVGMAVFCPATASAQTLGAELPPGVAHLREAKGGKGFEAFMQESLRESELFRRRILCGKDKDLIDPTLLAGALEQFSSQAPAYLQGRKGVSGFLLSEAKVRGTLQGSDTLAAHTVYGGFTGKWYGKWDRMSVDHHWGEIVEYDQPRRIEISGEKPVYLRSYQYCWVGDGYGLNVIASDNTGNRSGDYLLAYVVHIRDGDMRQPTKRRPHVGICVGPSKLIWVTAGEVFLEECYRTAAGVDAYAITGFFYRVKDKTLETTACFQAHYTRDSDHRPAWYSFPLKLEVGGSEKLP